MQLTEFLRGNSPAPTRAIPKSQPVQSGVTLARKKLVKFDNTGKTVAREIPRHPNIFATR